MIEPTTRPAATDAPGTPARRVRVSSEDAAERLIATTIAMLREVPFTELSVRTIAARADLNNSTIDRCFGSIENLYLAAAHRLALHAVERLPDSPDPTPLTDPDFTLSIRFRAWLISNGADPAVFRTTSEDPLAIALTNRQQRLHDVSPLTVQTFNQLIAFFMQGYIVFNETHAINEEIRINMLAMMYTIIESLPELERSLGWTGREAIDPSPPGSEPTKE